MNITQTAICIASITAGLALGACTDNEKTQAQVSRMSCTDLAREIGRVTQVKTDADLDSTFGTIDLVLSDDKEDQIVGGFESIAGDLTGAAARRDLDTLNAAFTRRGCG
ncbi:hypothetical protein [Actibacterium sp. 188UL27-1]|uniref:hypothetical protein n=1 Tax=Actibacterium sp. 188UL27-1 TaxID=2786961 RepID=UPI0019566ED5|nr:hypothetical protein [Actibacterium sp. 188UL27-1]MBM7069766.1 hypothetical protein [Actibacterium sp. 188UL27-1]